MKKYIFLPLLLLIGSLTANPIYTLASELSSSSSLDSSSSSPEDEVLVLAVNETNGFKDINNFDDNYRSVGSTFFDKSNRRVVLSNGGFSTAGSFFTRSKVFLANSANAGFSTFFEMDLFAGSGYADGFTFIVSRDINVLGSVGEGIGYGGITNSIAVIFDNYDNGGQPPLCLSLGVNGRQQQCFKYNGPAAGNFRIWIDYLRETQTLEVRINPSNFTRPVIHTQRWTGVSVDQIGDEFYTGFTASTGGATQYASLRSWYFSARYVTSGIDPLEAGTFITDNVAPIAPFIQPYLRNGTWFFKEDETKLVETGLSFLYTLGNNTEFFFLNENAQATFEGNDRLVHLYALDGAGNRSPFTTYRYHRATYILNYTNAVNEFYFYPEASINFPDTQQIDLLIPSRPGFEFLGWGTTPSQSTNLLLKDAFTADKVYFARWQMVDATIQFNTNGGSEIPDTITNIRTGFVLPEPPSKPFNTFAGWFVDAALTQPFDLNQYNYLSTTLYAKWTIDTYSVTYVSSTFGSNTIVIIDHGSTISVPLVPTHESYFVFDGWYADEACTQTFNFNEGVTQDTSIYAKWIDLRPNQAFIQSLNALNDPLSTHDVDALQLSRALFSELTPDQIRYLDQTYLAQLVALENHMINLLAVEAVVLLIDALPRIVSLEDGDLISEAVEAYANLTDEQKDLFPMDREHHLGDLVYQYSNLDQAKGVDILIVAIPITYGINDIETIEQAYAAFISLTPEEQAMVSPASKARILQAFSQLNQLNNANDFVSLVLAMGPSISLDDQGRIQEALQAYDLLTLEERAFINLEYVQLLTTYAKQHQDLTIALPVENQLLALPSTITLSDETAIREAQAAYDALSEDQQALVSAEAKIRLQNANQQLNVLLAPVDPEDPIVDPDPPIVDPETPTPPSEQPEGLYIPWIIIVVLAGWGGGYYLVQLRKKYLL